VAAGSIPPVDPCAFDRLRDKREFTVLECQGVGLGYGA